MLYVNSFKITDLEIGQEIDKIFDNLITTKRPHALLEDYCKEMDELEISIEEKMKDPTWDITKDNEVNKLEIMFEAHDRFVAQYVKYQPKQSSLLKRVLTNDRSPTKQSIMNRWEKVRSEWENHRTIEKETEKNTKENTKEVTQEVQNIQKKIEENSGKYTLADYDNEIALLEKEIADKVEEKGPDVVTKDPIYAEKAHRLNIQDQAYEILNQDHANAWREKLDKEVKSRTEFNTKVGKVKAIASLVWGAVKIGMFMKGTYDGYKDKHEQTNPLITELQLQLAEEETPKKVVQKKLVPYPKTSSKYDEENPQLCYVNESKELKCHFISAEPKQKSATQSQNKKRQEQLGSYFQQQKDPKQRKKDTQKAVENNIKEQKFLTKLSSTLNKTAPAKSDPEYPKDVVVHDLSYHGVARPGADEYLAKNPSGETTDLLKKQLAVFDSIDAKCKASETNKVKLSSEEHKMINDVLIGDDKAIAILGTSEELADLQQAFDAMTENCTGFYRAASLGVVHSTSENAMKQQITIQVENTKGSHATTSNYGYESSVYLNMIDDKIKEDRAQTMFHELTHVYHRKIINFAYDTEDFDLLIRSALAAETSAVIYRLFPGLRDIESKAEKYELTAEDRTKIDVYIKEINEAGLAPVINGIKSGDNISSLSNEDLVRIVCIHKACVNTPDYNTTHAWTDTEEAITIMGELPLLIDGKLTIIKDEQNEGAYARIEGIAPRVSHQTMTGKYWENKELLNIYDSKIQEIACNHFMINVTDAKVEGLMQKLEDGRLPNLKRINLAGAPISIEVARNLYNAAGANGRHINLVFSEKIQTQIKNELSVAKQAAEQTIKTGNFTGTPFAIDYLAAARSDDLSKIRSFSLINATEKEEKMFKELLKKGKFTNIVTLNIKNVKSDMAQTIISYIQEGKLHPKQLTIDSEDMDIETVQALVKIAEEKGIELPLYDQAKKDVISLLTNSSYVLVNNKYSTDTNLLDPYRRIYLSELDPGKLPESRMTNLDFSYGPVDKEKARIFINLFMDGKFKKLQKIGLEFGAYDDSLILAIIDARDAGKLPNLEKIEINKNTKISSPKLLIKIEAINKDISDQLAAQNGHYLCG